MGVNSSCEQHEYFSIKTLRNIVVSVIMMCKTYRECSTHLNVTFHESLKNKHSEKIDKATRCLPNEH